MYEDMRRLLEGDPVRFLGTDGMDRTARVLVETLESLGYDVSSQPVQYQGWRKLADPEVYVTYGGDGFPLEAKMMIYSSGIDVRGEVESAGRQRLIGVFDWRHFDVVDEGIVVARLIATDEGPAIPLSLDAPGADVPSFIIGADDGDKLEGLLSGNRSACPMVRVRAEAEFLPDRVFVNVIGSRGGRSAEKRVLVCAHYDSIYDSPGANDNGSGVLCATMVARELADLANRLDLHVTIAFFGGEELLQLGSKAYLERGSDGQDSEDIDLVINLDMVGVGEYMWPWVDDQTEAAVKSSLAHNPCPHPVKIQNPPLAGDHYPFYERGVPSVCLIWWPDPNYHQPGDTFGKLDPQRISYTARLCVDIIREVFSGG